MVCDSYSCRGREGKVNDRHREECGGKTHRHTGGQSPGAHRALRSLRWFLVKAGKDK